MAAEEFLHGASNFQNDEVNRDLPNEINNMLSELKQLSMAMQKWLVFHLFSNNK